LMTLLQMSSRPIERLKCKDFFSLLSQLTD